MALMITQNQAEILARVDALSPDMIKTVKAWSKVNSGSKNPAGLAQMRALLREAFTPLGAVITEEALPDSPAVSSTGETVMTAYEPSLLITQRPLAGVQLVLTGHYDTVFPKDYHFQIPDMIDEDTLRGPGVADMKGGILVMLNALMLLERSKDAANIGYSVLLSPDEEIGSPGSASLLAKLGKAAHLGLTYEPALSDGSLAGARKGSGNFALTVRGKSAHAGRDHHLGRNAIAALSRFIVQLDALNGQRDGVTFNIGKVDGGGATNIVPELAIGRFNVRMVKDEDTLWIREQLEALVNTVSREDGIRAELSGGFSRPPKPMAPANAQVFDWVRQAGLALDMDIVWNMSGGVCEGNNLWASGCPNVDTLGVVGGNIHSDQEFMYLSSFAQRTRLSTLILLKLASGEFDARTVKRLAVQDGKA